MLTIVTADKIVHVQFFFFFFPTLQKYDIIATGWVSCDVNSRQTFLWLYYVKMLFLSVISTFVAVGNSDLLFLPFVKFFFIILFSFLFPPTFFRVIYNLCTPNHFTSPLRTCLFFFITLSLPPLFFFIAYFSVQSETLHINPLHTLIPSTMCVSFGVMLPVGNPPNAIVFSYGHVQIRDMVRHTNTHSLSHNLLAPAESKDFREQRIQFEALFISYYVANRNSWCLLK